MMAMWMEFIKNLIWLSNYSLSLGLLNINFRSIFKWISQNAIDLSLAIVDRIVGQFKSLGATKKQEEKVWMKTLYGKNEFREESENNSGNCRKSDLK